MPKVKIVCKTCSNVFKDYLSNNRKFCSRKCFESNEDKNKSVAEKSRINSIGNKNSLGKKHTEETKKKIKEKAKKRMENPENRMKGARYGKEASNWHGGKSFEKYPQEWKDTLREAIRQRDEYVCQECGIHQDELGTFIVHNITIKKKLDVHHINYNKHNCNPGNLISLCKSCHSKTNYNRDYWFKYFSCDYKE